MLRGVLAALAILFGTLSAFAQDWPTKSVRIIVPFAAGATPDLVARLIDPLGNKVTLFTHVGIPNGQSGFSGTIFDDNASTPIQNGGPPFSGRFIPQLPLGALG